MRRFALGLLVVSGLALGCTPPAPAPTDPAKPAGGAAPTSGSTSASITPMGAKLVSMKVDMHCPHGCYPSVKKTLEGIAGVEAVDLAKQKDPDVIDNPIVFIKHNGNFDMVAAISALEKEGFKSEAVN